MQSSQVFIFAVLSALILCLFLWTFSDRSEESEPQKIRTHYKALAKQRDSRESNNQSKSEDIKVLCWYFSMNTPSRVNRRQAVQDTWGKRCDKLLTIYKGDKLEEVNGTLTVPIREETREELWHKAAYAATYIHDNYLNHYDWFMKCDDDTYLIVDSLKKFLSLSSPDAPIVFGHRFKPFVHQGYMSGGSGYAMSRQALKLLVENGISKSIDGCPSKGNTHEDVGIGQCLEAVGVEPGDTRDEQGRPRFLPLQPSWLITQKKVDSGFWYSQYEYYGKPKPGKDCCSDRPISFHYIEPELMYLLDWILYDVKRSE